MLYERCSVPDLVLIGVRRNRDARGYFAETYRQDHFVRNIADVNFVQDNCSMSAAVGTVRGLHFQLEPKAQGKLVSCTAGALLDVAVDIRTGSPTYGKFVAEELSAKNGRQLWVPAGFAHGFCTLLPETVISYKVTDYYSAEHDRGLLWNDPALGIDWPVEADKAILSDKDQRQPKLAELGEVFRYSGPSQVLPAL